MHFGGESETVGSEKTIRNLKAKQMLFNRYWKSHWAWFGSFMQQIWVLTRWLGWRLQGSPQQVALYSEVWRRRADYGRFATREEPAAPTRQEVES